MWRSGWLMPDYEQIKRDIDALIERIRDISEEAVGARCLYLIAAVAAHARTLLRGIDASSATVRKCIRAICTRCREESPVKYDERLRTWFHPSDNPDGHARYECGAALIREQFELESVDA